MFQQTCLYMFGGWWADMDYFMLQLEPPATEGKTWLLATEYERRTSTYQKAPAGTMTVGKEVVSVKRDSPLLL